MNTKRLYHLILLLFVLLGANAFSYGQTYSPKVRKVSIQEGLSNRFVNSIFQDSRGFIWIGCNYGLNRYDGKQMKVYTKEKHGLKNNNIAAIKEMSDSLLIIIHRSTFTSDVSSYLVNFTLFDPIHEKVIKYDSLIPKVNRIDEDSIIGFFNKMIIGNDRINVYKKLNGRFVYESSIKTPNLPIQSGYTSKKSWIAMLSGTDSVVRSFYELGGEGLVFRGYLKETKEKAITDFQIVHKDKEGNIYYSGNQIRDLSGFEADYAQKSGFLTFKLDKSGKTIPFGLRGKAFDYDYYHDAEARIIFLEALGICVVPTRQCFDIFDLEGNFIKRTEDILPNLDIRGFLVDDNNRIWFQTTDGAIIVDFTPELFTKHMSVPNIDPYNTPGNKGNAIRGMCDDLEGNLWLCRDNGNPFHPLVKITKGGEVEYIETMTNLQKKVYFNNAVTSTYAIERDGNGMLWLTDDHYSLYKVNPKTEEIQHFTYPELKDGVYAGYTSDRPFANRAICFDEERDTIWIGHNNGISFLDLKKDYLEEYTFGDGEKDIGIVYCLHQNEAGIWIGTERNGLYLFQPSLHTKTHYHSGDSSHYLPHSGISHIYEDKEGLFWMTSKGGGGLLKWNPNTGNFKKYTAAEGLSHNVTYGVYEDDFEDLWMSSDAGIMRFNKESERVDVYLPKDGIPHIECNLMSHHQGVNGRLYFGGLNGLVAFDPKDFHESDGIPSPQLQVVEYRVLDKSSGIYENKTAAFLEKPVIDLFGNHQAFALRFALLDYFAPEQNTYKYKIEGFQKDWNYIDEPVISTGNLPYGEYVIRIVGRGTRGLWSKHELAIPLLVPMPFYMQWWFILSLLGLFILLIYAYINWRVKSLKEAKETLEEEVKVRTKQIAEQAEELKALDKVKSRFFANISHELRTPLTLILGPLHKILKKNKVPDKETTAQLEVMQKNGKQLLGLVEEILDLSKLEASQLDVTEQVVPLESFVKRIFYSFESLANYKNIELKFENKATKDLRLYLDDNKVEKVVNNLLSNALKFTMKEGEILLSIKENTNTINITVEDSGEGIHPKDLPKVFDRFYQSHLPEKKAQGGTGIGLALSKELAELLGGKLYVESRLGEGSTFYLELPKKIAQLDELEVEEEEEEVLEEYFVPIGVPTVEIHSDTKILIVEDHPDMRDYIQNTVGEFYQTISAENGQEALDILEAQHEEIDFIISDVMMPIMDGFQLLNILKENKYYRTIPVIMLTARAALEDKLFALRVGVDDYLTKPFVADELLVRIHNLLNNYKERQAWSIEEAVERAAKIELAATEGLEVAVVKSKPARPEISEEDQDWLIEIEKIVAEKCGNNNFTVDWLSAEIAISPRQLQRRLKKLTGLTPKNYITEVRLQTARTLIENKTYNTIAQVMYHVGFQKRQYFAKIFVERFGFLPSEIEA